uniref:Tail terminator protein n=1 Tax=Pseudomonas phage Pavpe01 TaxID=3138545 RepID=A0AAU6W084_9VIRU
MTTTYTDALDEMFGKIKAAIDGPVNTVLGYKAETRWPFVAEPTKPDNSKIWLRVSTQIVDEQQSTLSTCEGLPGQKRYESAGLLFIELYLPKAKGDSGVKGRKVAVILRDLFRNAASGPTGITYYRARINDGIAPEELFYRLNVVTEFEYDEIK